MTDLHLASDFAIPADAVTQTFAILSKRGAGKTYTASVFVEELLKAGLHAVVVDPVGHFSVHVCGKSWYTGDNVTGPRVLEPRATPRLTNRRRRSVAMSSVYPDHPPQTK